MRVAISRALAVGLACAAFWACHAFAADGQLPPGPEGTSSRDSLPFLPARPTLVPEASEPRPWPNVRAQWPNYPHYPVETEPEVNNLGLLRTAAEVCPWLKGCADEWDNWCAKSHSAFLSWTENGGFYAGAEFLLLKTHFSQAYAYARVVETLAPPIVRSVQAVQLPFDYDPSVRAYVGYRLGDNSGDFRFTYWHFRTDARSGETVGSPAGLHAFIVDPLGSMAPTGSTIRAHASVENNVYDLDFIVPALPPGSRWSLAGSAGVRIADINQSYDDPITGVSTGFFTAHFVGAGPRLGGEARRYFGDSGCFSLFAKADGALLVGDYTFKAGAAFPIFAGHQSAHLTRTIPVAEMELGASWRPRQFLTLSAGWLFQAWFDLGASGGQFGGIYVPVDTANIMSFDGLVLRAELTF